jgi:outer membrane biosynthesis protein TonB
MRNQNRATTRVTISLDNTRLLLVIGGGLLALLGMFAIGVMVGARLGETGQPEGNLPPLAAIDDSEARYEQTRELLARTEIEAQEKAQAAQEAQAAEEAQAQAEVVEPAIMKELADSEQTSEDKPPVVEEKREQQAQETPKEQAPKAEPPKQETAKQEVPKAEPPQQEPPKQETPKQEAITPPAQPGQTTAPSGKFYAIQISSSPNGASAHSWVSTYKPFDSRKPYVVEAQIEGKGTWYRIKIGKFETLEQATAYQAIFESKTNIKNTILTLD